VGILFHGLMGVIRGMFLSMTIATGYPSDGSNIEICY
jgi:hypothetical protein